MSACVHITLYIPKTPMSKIHYDNEKLINLSNTLPTILGRNTGIPKT